jgi:O-antigen biosynthesis protein WbqP
MLYKKVIKRLLDIVLSLLGLIVTAIPMAVISLVIKREDPGPVIFKQKRFGIHKSFFTLYKFRSMKMSTPHDVPTHQLEDPEQYLLKSGKFIRKYSLDELPQLLNIFKGDMSVIGPRPALWNQDDLIAERDQYGANDVRPGLTGWAQINGYRGDTSIRKRIEYDIYYIENWSVGFDIKIMFLTIFKGFINKNAY